MWIFDKYTSISLSLTIGAGGNLHECMLKGKTHENVEGIKNWNVSDKKTQKVSLTYLKFSELNSDSRNLRNCSLPTGSFKASSMPNPHRFTLCCPGSLLKKKKTQQTHNQQYFSIVRLCVQYKLSPKVQPWTSYLTDRSYLCNVQRWATRLLLTENAFTLKKQDFQLGNVTAFWKMFFFPAVETQKLVTVSFYTALIHSSSHLMELWRWEDQNDTALPFCNSSAWNFHISRKAWYTSLLQKKK